MLDLLQRRLNRMLVRIKRQVGFFRPRIRGYMLAPNVTIRDLHAARETGANLFRYQIFFYDWEQFLRDCVPVMDMVSYFCELHGAKVVFDLHRTPGDTITINGRRHSTIFFNKSDQIQFLNIWRFIAERYKGNPYVWGYDLINEPAFWGRTDDNCLNLVELYELTIKLIREIDSKVVIIIQPPFGDPQKIEKAKIRKKKRVWYSVHVYYPLSITHQMIPGRQQYQTPRVYPYRKINRTALRAHLEKCVQFEEENNVRIYVGEFSCVNFAPGDTAPNYIKDCISLFEVLHWPWTYHAWREWQGWSPETSEKTMTILKTFFRNNR